MATNERCLKTFFAANCVDFIFEDDFISQETYVNKKTYVNTCIKTVSISERSGEKIELVTIQGDVNRTTTFNKINGCVKMLDRMMKERGLYVIVESSAGIETYSSFYKLVLSYSNSYIQHDLSHYQNMSYKLGRAHTPDRIRTQFQNCPRRQITYDEWIKIGSVSGYSWYITYFIPEDNIPNYDSLYVQNLDIVVSFENMYCILDHPYSQEGMINNRLKTMSNNDNSPKIVFIDRSGVLGNLFMRTIDGCRMIHPIENPDPNLEDGVWLDHVWYDINKPRENQVKKIYIPYDDTETLAKYGLFKTYSEATLSDNIRSEFEKLKYKEQYQKEKDAHRETKLKEYSKVLGYVAAILTAFVPLTIKLFGKKTNLT